MMEKTDGFSQEFDRPRLLPLAGVVNDKPVARPGKVFCFDSIRVSATEHQLLRSGVEQAIEPKAYAVLLELLEHAGEVVGRHDLLDRVWGHRHVTPAVLTRAVGQIRAALGDHAGAPRYVQTVHTLGYRFIGRLQPAAEPSHAWQWQPSELEHGSMGAAAEALARSKDCYALARRYWWERTPASLEEALKRFQQCLQLDPRNARAYCGLADSWLLLHRYTDACVDQAFGDARLAIAVAQGMEPELAEAHASQGLLEIEMQHYPLAVDLLQLAIATDASLVHAHAWLAMALMLDGRVQAAQGLLRDALRHDPGNIVLLAAQAAAFTLLGHRDSAEQVLVRIRGLNPSYLELYWQRAWTQSQHGQLAAAWRALRDADESAGANTRTHLFRAELALLLDLPEPAGAVGNCGIGYWRVHTRRLWREKRWQEAANYLAGLDRKPTERANIGACLGHCLALGGRDHEAIAQYEAALSGDCATIPPMLRPWDLSHGLGEAANFASLLDPEHPRRQALIGGLNAQLQTLDAGGIRLPVLDYQRAVLHALDGRHEICLATINAAIDAGFADWSVFERELAWRDFPLRDALSSSAQRMQRAIGVQRDQVIAS